MWLFIHTLLAVSRSDAAVSAADLVSSSSPTAAARSASALSAAAVSAAASSDAASAGERVWGVAKQTTVARLRPPQPRCPPPLPQRQPQVMRPLPPLHQPGEVAVKRHLSPDRKAPGRCRHLLPAPLAPAWSPPHLTPAYQGKCHSCVARRSVMAPIMGRAFISIASSATASTSVAESTLIAESG